MATTPPKEPRSAKASGARLDRETLRATGSLRSTHTAVSKLIDTEAVAATGHDPTTIDLLVRLDQSPHQRLRSVQLSQQLLLSPSHISRMVDRAEEAGLVERCVDLDDRRASQVAMTDAGRTVLADFAPRLERIIDDIVTTQLSTAEANTLVDLLQRIEAATHGR
jgi:DNA-binding MarR family transcriptional regulator